MKRLNYFLNALGRSANRVVFILAIPVFIAVVYFREWIDGLLGYEPGETGFMGAILIGAVILFIVRVILWWVKGISNEKASDKA